jgi:hypothetical protein
MKQNKPPQQFIGCSDKALHTAKKALNKRGVMSEHMQFRGKKAPNKRGQCTSAGRVGEKALNKGE